MNSRHGVYFELSKIDWVCVVAGISIVMISVVLGYQVSETNKNWNDFGSSFVDRVDDCSVLVQAKYQVHTPMMKNLIEKRMEILNC